MPAFISSAVPLFSPSRYTTCACSLIPRFRATPPRQNQFLVQHTLHASFLITALADTPSQKPAETNEANSPSSSPNTSNVSKSSFPETSYDSGGINSGKNNNNHGAGNGQNSPPGNDDDGDNSPEDDPSRSIKNTWLFVKASDRLRPAVKSIGSAFVSTASIASDITSSTMSFLLKNVPAPVIVALISLSSTWSATNYKARLDARAAAKARQEATRKRKEKIEGTLREVYEEYASPILKSSAKLAERLQFLVDTDWDGIENNEGGQDCSPLYSAYLFGRFFAHIGILKQERSLLDYGFPTADRILSNILGRIQGVLCANDRLLIHMQHTEHFFKPAPGESPLRAGPLKLSPRAQIVIGELMLRRMWFDRTDFVHVPCEAAVNHGPKAVLSFFEFSKLYKESNDMQQWFKPLVRDFSALEKFIRATPREKRRSDRVGARLYILQSSLLDLIEFFDPLPHPSSIPEYQRCRLSLGATSYREEQRSPMSLRLLYGELSNFRDHRSYAAGALQRLSVPHRVEVFVTGTVEAGDSRVESTVHGTCPYSHRVLIALKEMGIPHKTIPISLQSKPAWFYLLHPWERTPVIYHNGNVVTESGNIVGYLMERFPTARRLSSANDLKLAVGTQALTRFHPHFMDWVGGNDRARIQMEQELHKLEATIREAQIKNEGLPFLGGERFSREDTAIVPCLHIVEVGARTLKGWKLPKHLVSVHKYLEEARKEPSFRDSGAEEEAIVRELQGYNAKVNDKMTWRLSDMPE